MRTILLVNAAFEFAVAGLTLFAPQLLLGPVGPDVRAVARVLAANALALAVYSLLAALHRDLEGVAVDPRIRGRRALRARHAGAGPHPDSGDPDRGGSCVLGGGGKTCLTDPVRCPSVLCGPGSGGGYMCKLDELFACICNGGGAACLGDGEALCQL